MHFDLFFAIFFTKKEVLICHVKIANFVQGMIKIQSHCSAGYGNGILNFVLAGSNISNRFLMIRNLN